MNNLTIPAYSEQAAQAVTGWILMRGLCTGSGMWCSFAVL